MSLLKDSVIQQELESETIHHYYGITFKAGKIVASKNSLTAGLPKNVQLGSLENLKLKGTSGKIKNGTVSRIEKFLSVWIKGLYYQYEENRNIGVKDSRLPIFITLTLPAQQIHPDEVLKRKCLMPFIQDLRRYYKVENYFWKAELQENYNIHFHLIVDHYVDKFELQKLWNTHLNKLEYVDRFFFYHGKKNPPTTHVEKIENMQMAISYITKYVCKSGMNACIGGRKWEASKDIKNLKAVSYIMDNCLEEYISWLIEKKKVTAFHDEWFSVFSFTKNFDWSCDYSFIEAIERKDLLAIINELYNPTSTTPHESKKVFKKAAPAPTQLRLAFDVLHLSVEQYVLH